MALVLLDQNENPLTDFHGYVDGVSGGVYEFQVFVQNTNDTFYYTGVQLKYLVSGLDSWYSPDTSRLTVRMHTPINNDQTGTRPSAIDWSNIDPADTLDMPDIGSSGAGTTTLFPVWVRVFVPGNTDASILSHGLKVSAEKLVA